MSYAAAFAGPQYAGPCEAEGMVMGPSGECVDEAQKPILDCLANGGEMIDGDCWLPPWCPRGFTINADKINCDRIVQGQVVSSTKAGARSKVVVSGAVDEAGVTDVSLPLAIVAVLGLAAYVYVGGASSSSYKSNRRRARRSARRR